MRQALRALVIWSLIAIGGAAILCRVIGWLAL